LTAWCAYPLHGSQHQKIDVMIVQRKLALQDIAKIAKIGKKFCGCATKIEGKVLHQEKY
ncbi:40371_t:CDS:1, partial [Gigaspora margarita]